MFKILENNTGGELKKKEEPKTFKDWAHEIPTLLLSLGITHVALQLTIPCQTRVTKQAHKWTTKIKTLGTNFKIIWKIIITRRLLLCVEAKVYKFKTKEAKCYNQQGLEKEYIYEERKRVKKLPKSR